MMVSYPKGEWAGVTCRAWPHCRPLATAARVRAARARGARSQSCSSMMCSDSLRWSIFDPGGRTISAPSMPSMRLYAAWSCQAYVLRAEVHSRTAAS